MQRPDGVAPCCPTGDPHDFFCPNGVATAPSQVLLREILETLERIQGSHETQYEQDLALSAAIAKLRSAAGVDLPDGGQKK